MEINEGDVLLYIKTYQYSKAKKLLSYFLKNLLQTLQTQHDENILALKSSDDCISSVIFSFLSKKSTKFHKGIDDDSENYRDKYKDVLRFLSAHIFEFLNCYELVFNDDSELEIFLKSGQDIVDILLNCDIDKKIALLQNVNKRLHTIDGNLSPLTVISVFEDIMSKTNSFTLSELRAGIEDAVNKFGGKEFNWKSLRAPAQFVEQIKVAVPFVETMDTADKNTITEDVTPLKFSKTSQTDDIIIDDGKILFAETVLNILGLTDVEFQTLTYSNIHSILNEYVRSRLKKAVSSETVSEADIKCMYLKYKDLCESFSIIFDELKVLDPKAAVAKIKSRNQVIEKLLQLINVDDEYVLFDLLEQQHKLVKTLNINYTNYKFIQDSISKLLDLNNNSTLNKFVIDFRKLHETFLQCDFNVLFSLENLEIMLKKLPLLVAEIDSIKNQLSNKTIAYDRLYFEVQPLLSLEDEMGLDLASIAVFLNGVYKQKPLNVDIKNYLSSCQRRIVLFEEVRKESIQLQSDNTRLSSEVTNLERELTDYQQLKSDNAHCKQKLSESDQIILDLSLEKDQISQQLAQLERDHEEFKNALILAEQYNIERNAYIEDLENQIRNHVAPV